MRSTSLRMSILIAVSIYIIELFIGNTNLDTALVFQIDSFLPDRYDFDVNQDLIDQLDAYFGGEDYSIS